MGQSGKNSLMEITSGFLSLDVTRKALNHLRCVTPNNYSTETNRSIHAKTQERQK